jgi:hypothetical protein
LRENKPGVKPVNPVTGRTALRVLSLQTIIIKAFAAEEDEGPEVDLNYREIYYVVRAALQVSGSKRTILSERTGWSSWQNKSGSYFSVQTEFWANQVSR